MILFLILIIFIVIIVMGIKYPYVGLVIWGILGSDYDAAGVVGFFSSYFKYYDFFMKIILIVIFIVSIWRYIKLKKNLFDKYILLAIVLIFWIIASFVIVAMSSNIIIFPNILYPIINFSPLIMLVWILNYEVYSRKRKKMINYIIIYVYLQIILAFLIVYLPEIDIHVLNKFSGANYISDGYIYNKNIFYLTDIIKLLKNKYLFNGLGQFHNSNDMGFYGVVGIVCSIYVIRRGNIYKKIISILILFFSIFLWGNSGMRGPVIGVFIGLIIYIMYLKKNIKFILNASIGSIIILFLALKYNEILNRLQVYLIPDKDNISFISRRTLRLEGIKYIVKNPIIGAGGMLGKLTIKGIDPHELPLRIGCLFGIPASIMIIYLIYIFPILKFIKIKNKEILSILFYSIIVMVSLTNNYTDICLFWFLFSEVICNFQKRKKIWRVS